MKVRNAKFLGLLMVMSLFFLTSCQSNSKRLPDHVIDKKIPTIAVLEFNDKSQARWKWNVGEGIRDTLIDELVQSQRYEVVTRQDIDAVISELQIQQDGLFRKQGKVDLGQLKNVEYLLKGSVTDFSHVATTGLTAFFSNLGISGRSHMAIVTVTLYIIEVESGEIITSKQVEGKAYASSLDVKAKQDDAGFGSTSFYRTPLGKACKQLIAEAMDEINTVIASQKWNPRIITVSKDQVIISGGVDRGLEVGNLYTAYSPGLPLVDPETGDVLGHTDGSYAGKIQLISIKDKFSYAKILKGKFTGGQHLRQLFPVEK